MTAVLGLKRAGVTGALLLVVGIAPLAVSSLGRGSSSSLLAVSVAPILSGALYLLSATIKGGQPVPSARTDTGTVEHPKAA